MCFKTVFIVEEVLTLLRLSYLLILNIIRKNNRVICKEPDAMRLKIFNEVMEMVRASIIKSIGCLAKRNIRKAIK